MTIKWQLIACIRATKDIVPKANNIHSVTATVDCVVKMKAVLFIADFENVSGFGFFYVSRTINLY